MIISLILIALFISLLPFCPVWISIRDAITHNWSIRHVSLWVVILYRIKVKNSREKLQILSYRQVIEMYNHRIKE